MSLGKDKNTFFVESSIPSEIRQVNIKKEPWFVMEGNFFKLPFFEKYDINFNEAKVIEKINKKYYCKLIWSSVNTTVYSEKFYEYRPSNRLSFSLGIHPNTRQNDFGYERYQTNGWYLGNINLVSNNFQEFQVDELKLIISNMRTEMIGRDISLNIYHNSDIYFGDSLDDLIDNITTRIYMIAERLKVEISDKTGKSVESVTVDVNHRTLNGSVFDTMRREDLYGTI